MISFLNPGFLVMLAALGPVLALYFLKSKPLRRVVPSNLIWTVVFNRIKPNSFFQKFQNSLFLLFQVLAITLLALAAARPIGIWGGNSSRLIILDVSASMQAADVSPSRFQAAVKRAEALCAGFSGRVGLYTLGDSLQPLAALSPAIPEVQNLLKRLSPTHCATPSPEKFLRQLRDLEGLGADEIFLLTDTLDPTFPSDFMPGAAISVETFGNSGNNVGIIGAEAAWDGINQQLNAGILVQNDNDANADISFSLEELPELGGVERTAQGFPVHITLAPKQRMTVSLPPIPAPKAVIKLSANRDRNISEADDRWYLCDPGLRPKVFIDAPPESLLFRLKQALPMIEFFPFTKEAENSPEAVVLSKSDSIPMNFRLPICRFAPGPGKLQSGEILPWEDTHPLLKFSNWDAAPVEGLAPGALPGMALVEAVGGTLLSESIDNNGHSRTLRLWAAFDPDHPAFKGNMFLPVFLYNCLEYMLKDNFPKLSYPAGNLSLQGLFKGKAPLVAGFHEIPDRAALSGGIVAVNLQAPSEAQIAPAQPKKPTLAQKAAKNLKEQESSPWRTILSVALIFFLSEWYLYLRRT